MKDFRQLHLLGALGTARTEMIDGREHLVVPVIALMEGVIHAVNAETPEFVPVATLEKAAKSWDGRPVTLGHPKKDGKQCSAKSPEIIEAFGIGTIRNTHVKGTAMHCEALIDKVRAKKLHPDMYTRLAEGGTEEVSVGALVVTNKIAGRWTNGKPFIGSWVSAEGDHLAFLPGGRGACSVAMGCGTHRAAMRVCGDHLEDVVEKTVNTRSAQAGDATEEAAELIAYKAMRSLMDGTSAQWDEVSQLIDDLIADETENPTETPEEEVAEETLETARLDSIRALCQSMSNVLSSIASMTYSSSLSDMPRYYEENKALAGARHSSADMKAIQAVHDHSMTLGATCDRSNYKLMEGKLPADDSKIKETKMNDPTRDYIGRVKLQKAK